MAFQVSPGVLVQEKDLTNVIPAVATSIGAIAGDFTKGPTDEIVSISSEKDLVETFGKPTATNFEHFFSASSFLQYGNSLRVVRTSGTGLLNATESGSGLLINNTTHYQDNNADGSASNGLWGARTAGSWGNNLKISSCPSATVYEDLRKKTNSDKYEFILPNILYGKTFFTEKFCSFDFKSNALHKNYETNKYTTFLTNDIIWYPGSNITKSGFVNTLEGMLKNTNYEAKNTTDYKTDGPVNELSSVLTYKSSFPMQKKGIDFSYTFAPNFVIRYAPSHMRNLSGDDVTLKYANLYSTNKTSEIDTGLSAILGFEFKKNI